ncbi:hypothetical protein Anapl_06733 [Anas platyrhynchos]|uniref:Uncharacterized protein n=1 Tax=Anas platyrhynchos TaxID=8839 RepID=R0M0Z0_ANAPL|nr:hypothetical protein Anapl_06733 [Anas platyrhynchos]
MWAITEKDTFPYSMFCIAILLKCLPEYVAQIFRSLIEREEASTDALGTAAGYQVGAPGLLPLLVPLATGRSPNQTFTALPHAPGPPFASHNEGTGPSSSQAAMTHDRNQGLQLLSLPNALLCLEDQCRSVGNAQNWSPDAKDDAVVALGWEMKALKPIAAGEAVLRLCLRRCMLLNKLASARPSPHTSGYKQLNHERDERTLSDNKAVQTARNRLTPNTDGTLHSAQRINTAVADPVALLWSTTPFKSDEQKKGIELSDCNCVVKMLRIAKIPNKFNRRCESIVNGLRSEAAEDAPLKIKHDVHSHTLLCNYEKATQNFEKEGTKELQMLIPQILEITVLKTLEANNRCRRAYFRIALNLESKQIHKNMDVAGCQLTSVQGNGKKIHWNSCVNVH